MITARTLRLYGLEGFRRAKEANAKAREDSLERQWRNRLVPPQRRNPATPLPPQPTRAIGSALSAMAQTAAKSVRIMERTAFSMDNTNVVLAKGLRNLATVHARGQAEIAKKMSEWSHSVKWHGGGHGGGDSGGGIFGNLAANGATLKGAAKYLGRFGKFAKFGGGLLGALAVGAQAYTAYQEKDTRSALSAYGEAALSGAAAGALYGVFGGGPIGAAVGAAIGAVIGVASTFIGRNFDEILSWSQGKLDTLSDMSKKIWSSIGSFVSDLADKAKEAWNSLSAWGQGLWKKLTGWFSWGKSPTGTEQPATSEPMGAPAGAGGGLPPAGGTAGKPTAPAQPAPSPFDAIPAKTVLPSSAPAALPTGTTDSTIPGGLEQGPAQIEQSLPGVRPVLNTPFKESLSAPITKELPGVTLPQGSIKGFGTGPVPPTPPTDNRERPTPQQLYDYAYQQTLKATGDESRARNTATMLTAAAKNESNFNPAISHDHGTGYGLFGHRQDRLAAMREQAGNPYPDWQQQVKYAVGETLPGGKEERVGRMLSGLPTTDIKGLTDAQMHYERPMGYRADAPQYGHNYFGRYASTGEFSHLQPTTRPAVPFQYAQASQLFAPPPAATPAVPQDIDKPNDVNAAQAKTEAIAPMTRPDIDDRIYAPSIQDVAPEGPVDNVSIHDIPTITQDPSLGLYTMSDQY